MSNFHIGFTSHREVLFRNEQDVNTWFNCYCSALYKTDSVCYTECEMSDHHHSCCRSKNPGELIRICRDAYTKVFNNKYLRSGPLGERGVYIVEIKGINHLISEFAYTLRNPVHHGVVNSPFEYRYSSANCYFKKELGKNFEPTGLLTVEQIKKVLSPRAEFDPSWKMGVDGVFLRDSVVDISAVETTFGTAKAFNYYLSRKSSEDWKREQEEDDNGIDAITLETFENQVGKKVDAECFAKMLRNENSRTPVFRINDLELCAVIDTEYVPKYYCESVYHLKASQKNQIANELYVKYKAGFSQIKRCLVL